MQGFLSACTAVVPSAVEMQRRASKTVFTAASTGSTVRREGLSVVRAASHFPLNAVERTAGADVGAARRTVDAGFESAQDVSDGAEDRFLRALLSTSQLTAEYAELVDDSVERVCPVDGNEAG